MIKSKENVNSNVPRRRNNTKRAVLTVAVERTKCDERRLSRKAVFIREICGCAKFVDIDEQSCDFVVKD